MKTVEFQGLVRSEPFATDEKRVPGRGVEVAPGLVVGRAFTFDGKQTAKADWRIHHTPSGRGFGWFRTRAAGIRAAQRVAKLTDWTKSATAIRREGIQERVFKIIREESDRAAASPEKASPT